MPVVCRRMARRSCVLYITQWMYQVYTRTISRRGSESGLTKKIKTNRHIKPNGKRDVTLNDVPLLQQIQPCSSAVTLNITPNSSIFETLKLYKNIL